MPLSAQLITAPPLEIFSSWGTYRPRSTHRLPFSLLSRRLLNITAKRFFLFFFFLHPYCCLQQFLDLSCAVTSPPGKPALLLVLQQCSAQGHGSAPDISWGRCTHWVQAAEAKILHLPSPRASSAPTHVLLLNIPKSNSPKRQQAPAFCSADGKQCSHCNICAVTGVLRQKGNPQAIQLLHLPAWTQFPGSCLLAGLTQVLGWETRWEICSSQAPAWERGAEMGSRFCLTATRGNLALGFNSSRPVTGQTQASQRRWETGYPPPSRACHTSCLERMEKCVGSRQPPCCLQAACLPPALPWR